jgi:hypothetical protein
LHLSREQLAVPVQAAWRLKAQGCPHFLKIGDTSMSSTLASFLLRKYFERNGCSERPRKDGVISVDDRGSTDVAFDFCEISVTVSADDEDSFLLTLKQIPHNQDVAELIQDQGGELCKARWGMTATINLKLNNVSFIRNLAKAIRKVVGRGQRYAVRNWKWIADRTADSLEELADSLMEYRREKKKERATKRSRRRATDWSKVKGFSM